MVKSADCLSKSRGPYVKFVGLDQPFLGDGHQLIDGELHLCYSMIGCVHQSIYIHLWEIMGIYNDNQ